MILISGFFSLVFFTFILGLLVAVISDKKILEELLIESIVTSFYISFLIVFLSYLFHIPDISITLYIIAIVFLIFRRSFITIAYSPKLLIYILGIIIIHFLYLYGSYDLSFQNWDAVVSWNAWASQLFDNNHFPQVNIYPILLPSIWSLIYKAQGDYTLWIFAKLSLLVVYFLLILSFALLYRVNKRLSIFFIIANFLFLAVIHEKYLFSGLMDIPVMLFMLTGLTLLILNLYHYQLDNNSQRFINSLFYISIIFSLASITKQAGLLTLVMYVICLSYFLFTKVISRVVFYKNLFILFLPFILFLIMFLNATVPSDIIGNLSQLRKMTVENVFSVPVFSLTEFIYLVFFIFAAYSVYRSKTSHLMKLNCLILLTFVIGYIIFKSCCSYDIRNGIWLFSLLISSINISVLEYKSNKTKMASNRIMIKKDYVVIAPILIVFTFSALISFRYSDDRFIHKNYTEQTKLIPQSQLFLRNIELLNNSDAIVSGHLPIAFYTKLKPKFAWPINDRTRYLDFIAIGPNGFYNLCENKSLSSRTLVKRLTLDDVLECNENVYFYIIESGQFREIRRIHKEYNFKKIDSEGGWIIVKPTKKLEH